ncbi:serine/threonine-protein kinase Sgk2 [Nemania diffusa]|nr:serine/threonine-protein kinase Sgk2 [Nemania diffusa]
MPLSENQIAAIVANPLGKPLEKFRSQLREHAEAQSQDILLLLGDLLAMLVVSKAAPLLITPSGRDILTSLRDAFLERELDIEKSKLLVDAIVANLPDTDVWTAVLDLIQLIKPQTSPLCSLPPTFSGTPVEAYSDQLDYGESPDRIERDLFSEVGNCTFRGVGGFWDKFFNPQSWQPDQRHILDQMVAQHGENAWGFPPIPNATSVWEWLCRLETRFLAGSANMMFLVEGPEDLIDIYDVFFEAAKSKTPNEPHEYKNVLAVGELRKTHDPNSFKAVFLRLTLLVQKIFARQPTCRFVHAFSLCASTMELWVFHRSGPYSSGAFDVCREPEKFARALVGYATMDDNAMGRDRFTQNQQGNYQVTLYDANSGSNNNKERIITLTREIVRRQAIVSRGTTCYETDNSEVAKFSWASTKRELEVSHLKLAKAKGVQGVAKLVAYRQITTIAELRKGLRFPKPHAFRCEDTLSRDAAASTQKNTSTSGHKRKRSIKILNSPPSLKRQRLNSGKPNLTHELLTTPSPDATVEDAWENKVFSCLVISPAGRVISEFETIKELLESMRDAIKAHQSLYTLGGILHRDVSSNNIIITNPETADGFKGMLIDLDLAKVMNGAAGSGERQRCGTMQFIAVEVLRGADHTYRHDLESFFYVLLWMCARVAWTKPNWSGAKWEPENTLLVRWVTGDFRRIADAKLFHMMPGGFLDVIDEFPEACNVVKPLCRELRRILFPSDEEGIILFGTPPGPPDKLYNSILGAYDKAISEMP